MLSNCILALDFLFSQMYINVSAISHTHLSLSVSVVGFIFRKIRLPMLENISSMAIMGNLILTCGEWKHFRAWEYYPELQEVITCGMIEGHKEGVSHIWVDRDWVLTASNSGEVKIWNKDLECIKSTELPEEYLNSPQRSSF